MVYTVPYAFDIFRKDSVDLYPGETEEGRNSRDYLCEQLHVLQNSVAGFPRVNSGCIPFGSFSRKTKTRPLDDIDLLLPLNGRATQAQQVSEDPYEYWLHITDDTAPLAMFAGSPGYVSSTKVMYRIRDSLRGVPNYAAAGTRERIRKVENAITLDLLSYDWVFDIVPAVPISDSEGKTVYYLIPDGSGDWIRTDPRVDQRNATRVNQAHGGYVLPTIRLLKYWNKHGQQPGLDSYYFETLALKVFDGAPKIEDYPQAVEYFVRNHSTALWLSCPDPKGLGPDLDADVSGSTKLTVTQAMDAAAGYAGAALRAQVNDRSKEAIDCWCSVFGSEFPKYG